MSPRRSSRARATQPPPAAPTHTNSSTSSVSSGRAERNTRSKDKASPPRRSNPPRSQSIDDLDESTRPLRRTRSGAEEIKDPKNDNRDEQEEDDGEEEEVTRCICGEMEYPGLPSPTSELLKQQAKELGAAYTLDEITDELGGMFIQCDICKVWQHGGCVGILEDSSAPEEYFCEQCRRNLHKVELTPAGRKYSNYLPLKEDNSPPASPQPNRERSKRTTDSKGRQLPEPKRRATLNSSGIYNEQEAIRKAIEESKMDAGSGEGLRKKRSRSDSQERKDSTKRQRIGAKSDSPDADKAATSNSSSDEALASKRVDHTPKKSIRGAAARNHQAKEQREQKERERQEAAAKRKSRVERRRGDESDNLDDPSNPPPPSTVSTPPTIDAPQPRSSHRKNGRNAASSSNTTTTSKPRRLGRNQYTKDLPPSSLSNTLDPNTDLRNGASAAPGMRTRSRSRSNARDLESPSATGGGGSSVNGAGPGGGGGGISGPNGILSGSSGETASRPSRPKHMNPNRTSMNEMKKRVAAILEFVNRAEEEGGILRKQHTGSSTHSSASGGGGATGPGGGGGGSGGAPSISSEEGAGAGIGALADAYKTLAARADEALDFSALDSWEMLRTLKARLVNWEDQFGRYAGAAGTR